MTAKARLEKALAGRAFSSATLSISKIISSSPLWTGRRDVVCHLVQNALDEPARGVLLGVATCRTSEIALHLRLAVGCYVCHPRSPVRSGWNEAAGFHQPCLPSLMLKKLRSIVSSWGTATQQSYGPSWLGLSSSSLRGSRWRLNGRPLAWRIGMAAPVIERAGAVPKLMPFARPGRGRPHKRA